MRRAVFGLLLAGCVAIPGPALAAFPGANGLLAVRPLHGTGLLLVGPHGSRRSRICVSSPGCGIVTKARWSPDGRDVAVYALAADGTLVLYPDGSCLDCQMIPGRAPAFTTDPSVLTLTSGDALIQFGIDGVRRAPVPIGAVSDAVWSSQGQVAIVRTGNVLAGNPGHLRALGAGSDPSWAPDGSALVIDRGGWVTVIGLQPHSVHRLARGTRPVWSPDGKSVAFTAPGSALSVVSPSGGAIRRVGRVRGIALDWQPVPTKPATSCAIPPGSTTIASSDTAVVSTESATVLDGYPAPAYMGCLLATGRERLLKRFDFQSGDSTTVASQAAVAGNFAALVESDQDPHYGGSSSIVEVFDLTTGSQVSNLGGQQISCPDYEYGCASALDDLVINDQGFTAVHSTVEEYGTSTASVTEQILAGDSGGMRALDTVDSTTSTTTPPQALLTGLQLAGDSLTWQHSGTPESATLH